MKRLLTDAAGTLLIAPAVIAMCCENFWCIVFACSWVMLLYFSARLSPRVRKFWKDFYVANLYLSKML